MRNYTAVVLILLCLAPKAAIGQDEYPMKFSDTVAMEMHPFSYTTRPDTIGGDTVFRLANPECIVLLQVHMEYISFIVLKKEKKRWKMFNPAPYPEFDGGSYSFDTIDFDGSGSPELLVRWENSIDESGGSGWSNEFTSGFYLWDIDNAKLIFQMRDHHTFSSHWNDRFIDPEGEISANEVVESYCRNYIVSMERGRISIKCDPDCAEADEETGMILPEYQRLYEYEPEHDFLILKK